MSSALAGEFLTTGPLGKSTLTRRTLVFVSNTGSQSFPRGMKSQSPTVVAGLREHH